MSYCINPNCPNPNDPLNAERNHCRNCGSELILQGRYRVIGLVDRGGFANIFEVDDRGRRKILKVLQNNYEKVVQLFIREAGVLQQLKHPGIPRVESDGYFTVSLAGASDPLHCLIMEKIEGQNLEKWLSLNRNRPISPERALDWLTQLADILAFVHEQKYFHRDIKPSNIIVQPDGKFGKLALIDFGAVREITATYFQKIAYREITQLMTWAYAAPEQKEGAASPQSDFFALGRTFVHLLTGKYPLDPELKDGKTGRLIWQHLAPPMSQQLANLIDELMAPAPKQRPEDARSILKRLQKINPEPNRLDLAWHNPIKKWPIGSGANRQQLVKFGFAYLLMLGLQLPIGELFKDKEPAALNSAELKQAGFPELPIALNNQGVKNYVNAPMKAFDRIKQAWAIDPENPVTNYNLGVFCEDLKDFDCAREKYQIAVQGGVAAAHSNLARLHIVLKQDYAAAVGLLRQGLELKPTDRKVKYSLLKNLGWAHLGQKRYEDAKENLQAAIALDPDRASARCLLARVLEARGNQKDARVERDACIFRRTGVPPVS